MATLIENALILASSGLVRGGFLAYEGETILHIGKDRPAGAFSRVIDARGGMLAPGFYNCHNHSPMTLLRGAGEGLPLARWLREAIFPAEALLSPDDIYWGTLLSIAEMLRGGTVSFSDMYFFNRKSALAALDTGIRMNLARGLTGGDPETDVAAGRQIDEVEALFSEFGGVNPRLKVEVGVHAEYTSEPALVRAAVSLADKYGCGIQAHLCETAEEVAGCFSRRGMSPAAYFREQGLFTRRVTAAHCVHVTDGDMRILAEAGAFAAHCPESNLKLASGVAPVPRMAASGVGVVLGTDGCASNNNQSLLEELHLAALLHKGVWLDPAAVSPAEALHMATAAGAASQGRERCGALEEGYAADFALFYGDRPNLHPDRDPLSNLVYSAGDGDVRMTAVAGKILYEDGEYTTLDLRRVLFEAGRIAARLRLPAAGL